MKTDAKNKTPPVPGWLPIKSSEPIYLQPGEVEEYMEVDAWENPQNGEVFLDQRATRKLESRKRKLLALQKSKPMPIGEAKALAKKHNYTHMVVFGFGPDGIQHIATFGRTTEDSGQAADFANSIKRVLRWPESMLEQPSRVRRLQARVEQLEWEKLHMKIDPSLCGTEKRTN